MIYTVIVCLWIVIVEWLFWRAERKNNMTAGVTKTVEGPAMVVHSRTDEDEWQICEMRKRKKKDK